MRFYPTAVSATMWCNPSFYQEDEDQIARHLRPGDVFVDVGANVGALSLAASQMVGPGGRVFAIEAHPRAAKYLLGNVELNRAANVEVIHSAAGDHEGTVHFSSHRSDDQNRVDSNGMQVPLSTLDRLLPDVRIRLLKIDVEGFELFVLRGATTVLARTELVYFESWEQHSRRFGHSTSDVLAFLRDHGFEVGVPTEYRSEKCENLLAVRAA